jgi:HSP20 family protein
MALRRDPLREFDRLTRSLMRGHLPARQPSLLAVRTQDGVRLAFDLPGVDPATIDLTVRSDAVVVEARRRAEPWEPSEGTGVTGDDGQMLVDERGPVDIRREVPFEDVLVPDSARAEYRDGVLSVIIATRQEAGGRRVEVSVAGGEPVAVTGHADVQSSRAAHQADSGDESGTGPLAPPPPEGQQANPLPTS